MPTSIAYTVFGVVLAFAPAILRVLYQLVFRPELYAHDHEARLLNLTPPRTRWMNLGQSDPPQDVHAHILLERKSVTEVTGGAFRLVGHNRWQRAVPSGGGAPGQEAV